jgi:hypothetical protein
MGSAYTGAVPALHLHLYVDVHTEGSSVDGDQVASQVMVLAHVQAASAAAALRILHPVVQTAEDPIRQRGPSSLNQRSFCSVN